MKIIWRKKERRMKPKNEVNAKVRAGPRGRSQRQNPEQMVRNVPRRAHCHGVATKNEAATAQSSKFHNGNVLHRH